MLRGRTPSFEGDQLNFESLQGALSFTFWKDRAHRGVLTLDVMLMLVAVYDSSRGCSVSTPGPMLAGLRHSDRSGWLTIAMFSALRGGRYRFFYLAGVISHSGASGGRRRGNWIGAFLVPAAPFVCLITYRPDVHGPAARAGAPCPATRSRRVCSATASTS